MTFAPTEYLPYDFANRRHIGPSPEEMAEMLDAVGAADLDALIDQTIPANIRQAQPLDFGKPLSERELLHRMKETASKNKVLTSLIGFILALAIFLVTFFRIRAGQGWQRTLLLSAAGIAFMCFMAWILNRDFPPGLLQSYTTLPWPLT